MSEKPRPVTTLDLQVILSEKLELPAKEIESRFELYEEKGELVARIRRWLERAEFNVVAGLVRGWGGEYREHPKREFRIPIAPVVAPEVPEVVKPSAIFTKSPPSPLTCPSCGKGSLLIASRSVDFSDFWYQCNLCKHEAKTLPEKPIPSPEVAHHLPFTIIPIEAVLAMPFQSRVEKDEAALRELAETIRQYGVLEPVLVRPKPSGLYEIVAGQRRLDAARLAGLNEVPAVINELTDQQAYECHFIENLQREDLSDYEIGRMLHFLRQRFGYTQEELAEKFGKKQPWISKHIAHFELMEKEIIPRGIKSSEITEGQSRAIREAPEEKRAEIITRVIEESEIPSMREIRKLVQPPEPTTAPPQLITPEVTEIPEGPPKDVALERATKYYPLSLIDRVWQFVTIEARRLPFLKVIVDVLWDRAEQQGYSEQILEEARTRFEKPEEIKV